MPQRDGTGPQGMGPMTGRGKGFCRFRTANEPFRGKINNDDLRPLIREIIKEELKEK